MEVYDIELAELSDIKTEGGVIGTLILHPEYIMHSEYLKPEHFFGVENGCIYWAISELYKDGVTNIDTFNIQQKVNSKQSIQRTLENFNMQNIKESLELYAATARNTVEEYIMLTQTVLSWAMRRDLYRFSNRISMDCFKKDKSIEDLSNGVYDELDNITQKYVFQESSHTFGQDVKQLYAEVVNRRNPDGTYGIPSKFPSVNEYFTFERGELVVIQARYKEGKSFWVLNEVVHKLKNGVPTLVVDTEMQERLYYERLIAHLTKLPISAIKSGRMEYKENGESKFRPLTQDENDLIDYWNDWLEHQPFVVVNEPNITNEKLYSLCKMWKYKMGLEFVAFDYIKSNETDASDNYNILGAKCDFLKNRIANELDLAVLTACQLNREGKVADSDKINRYASVAIKVGNKSEELKMVDGEDCGNYFAKIYVNRIGKRMPEDDQNAYIDLYFDGARATLEECKVQHTPSDPFE